MTLNTNQKWILPSVFVLLKTIYLLYLAGYDVVDILFFVINTEIASVW